MSNYSDSSFDAGSANSSWYKVFHSIPSKSSVLDIGCSSGNFGAELIKRKGCVVDGIEVEPSDAKMARKKLRQVYSLDIENNDLSDINEKYDVIYFGDVIEHLVKPVETLKRVRPLLKGGGKILFSIPNMAHISVRLALMRGGFKYTETGLIDKTHMHFYDQHEVERVFNAAGYAITNLDFVEKDYPKQLLDNQLEKVGLNAEEKFYQLAAKPDASAFQFVGSAQPSKPRKRKLAEFGPIDLFDSFYENTKIDYEIQIKDLKNKLERAQQNLDSAQKHAQSAQEALRYKVEHPYRSVARHVKRKIKP